MNQNAGLNVNLFSWLIFVGLSVTWGATAFLWKQTGRSWSASVISSVFGLAWIGFGLQIVARFLLLSYDAFLFGDMSDRLAIRPVSVVNLTLQCAALYWVCITGGFAAVAWGKRPVLSSRETRAVSSTVHRRLIAIVVAATACVIVSVRGVGVPAALQTPLGILASIWVIPAAIVWYDGYRDSVRLWRVPNPRLLVLVPGVVHAVLSPYRESFLLVAAVPLVSGIFAGARFNKRQLVFSAIALVFVSTLAVNVLRRTLWNGEPMSDALMQETSWQAWMDRPNTAPWVQVAGRVHACDSLLLTVDLVPEYFPYSNRNVFVDALIQASVPRVLYREKQLAQRGSEFSTTIWAFDTKDRVSAARIAPSMAGDLYEAGGIPYVAIGAFIWGALLGALEMAKRRMNGAAAAGVTLLFAVLAMMAVERDFVFAAATMIQTTIMLMMIFAMFSDRRRRSSPQHTDDRRPQFHPVTVSRHSA